MPKSGNISNWIFPKLLSERIKHLSEKVILVIAIISYLIHLGLIFLVDIGFLKIETKLLDNAIAAIYTPFSFILVYEVYLLIYYLPRSFTTYIRKQYEIITLIIIRRLFKDLADLKLSSDWFEIKGDLQFTYDLIASIVLFYLLYLFFKLSKVRIELKENIHLGKNIEQFISFKKIVASFLVPILLFIALYNFINWSGALFISVSEADTSFKNINNIFFDEFFTILIVVDVLLLLASFFYSDEFHKVIRNSGFIISTILIRLSFSVEGLINTLLIISAIIFGLIILYIHNLYEKEIYNNTKA